MSYLNNAKSLMLSAPEKYCYEKNITVIFHMVSAMIPNKIDVDNLVLAFNIAYQDIMRKGNRSFDYLSEIPFYISEIAPDDEFAHEFRKKFYEEIFGIPYDELPDVNYGCNEIEPNIIDISNKDFYEVFAALYNASKPVGCGFLEYNVIPWDKEMAKYYFEKNATVGEDGVVSFKYIYGRPVHVHFDGNLLYVSGYNADNEKGLAQKVVATCPNVFDNDFRK